MRLLNVNNYKLKEFAGDPPPYAIASHRWYDWEPTKEDFYDRSNTLTPGCQKVLLFCKLVHSWDPEIEWLWIDTVCVNKHSSAELSEVIQSMMKWYQEARICFAYLHDVRPSSAGRTKVLGDFQHSVWFRRGWTLQELLAPRTVLFLTGNWELIGHKGPYITWPGDSENLNDYVAASTGIPTDVLRDYANAGKYSAEERINWSRSRQTTRDEDQVYSVLGLLDISMPILYGEGTEKAVGRLEDELTRKETRARDSQSREVSRSRTRALVRANEHPPRCGPRPFSSMSLPQIGGTQTQHDTETRRHTTSASTDPARYARDWTDIIDHVPFLMSTSRSANPTNHTPRKPSQLCQSSILSNQEHNDRNRQSSLHMEKPLPSTPTSPSAQEHYRREQSPESMSNRARSPAQRLKVNTAMSPYPRPTVASSKVGVSTPVLSPESQTATPLSSISPALDRMLQPWKSLWKAEKPAPDMKADEADLSNQMISDLQHSLARVIQELEQQRTAREQAERQLQMERAGREYRGREPRSPRSPNAIS